MATTERPRPIMLGVVGESAAGKTTLTAGLVRALGAERVSVICTDDYHRYDDDAHLDARLVLYGSLIHPDLSGLVACANGNPPSLQLSMGREGGRLAEFMHIAGSASEQEVLAVEQYLREQMGLVGVPDPQSIGVFPDGVQCHHSRPLALTQLLIVYHLLRARHDDARERATAPGPE
jgi:hypothetical protein